MLLDANPHGYRLSWLINTIAACCVRFHENLKIKRIDESGRGLCGNQRVDNWRLLISQMAGDCQIVSTGWGQQKRDRGTFLPPPSSPRRLPIYVSQHIRVRESHDRVCVCVCVSVNRLGTSINRCCFILRIG